MAEIRRYHQVDYRIDGDIAVITMDNPPVNGLSLGIRQGLVEAFTEARRDPSVRAIVLNGAGRGFSAGGDIKEFGTPAATAAPGVSSHVHPAIEESEKPVIAAIHGLAIGGGLETAMVCHYRIAAADTKVGLPELSLGVIPLSGTQRLPRVLGLANAIDLILKGKIVTARDLTEYPLFDEIVEGGGDAVLKRAMAFAGEAKVAEDLKAGSLPLIRHRDIPDSNPDEIIEAVRQNLDPEDVMAREGLDAIAAGVGATNFDEGMAAARAIWARLMESDNVREQKERFFAKERK